MPITYTTSLSAPFFSPFAKTFRWLDDPSEDDDFVAYVRGRVDYEDSSQPSVNETIRNIAVDRTGTEPTLTWEKWDVEYIQHDGQEDEEVWSQVGTGTRIIGPAGTLWRPSSVTSSSELAYLGQFNLPGFFECDQYGRAYKLSDLLAFPKINGLTGSVSATRVLVLEWEPNLMYAEYEVHEFLKVPNETLKATVTEPTRTSGTLAANQTLEYAVRGKTAAGEVGPFSDHVTVTITANGGTVAPTA